MKRERRQKLTRHEWGAITTRRPVVRKVPPPSSKQGQEAAKPRQRSSDVEGERHGA